jgi:glycosyltransferase involved in cell wall biosynthesis
MPEFQVGYLGRGAVGRARFPWAQYSYPAYSGQWGEDYLETCWQDLAGDRKGIIFTLWDASRLLWFADGHGTGMEKFLGGERFERWGYFMADASGVEPNLLPMEQGSVLGKYRRVVMASEWAYGLYRHVAENDLDWLPHPINRSIYKPVDRLYARSGWGVGEKELVVGCVMTNQQRKLWPVVLDAVAEMKGRPKLWIQTDTLTGYWNLYALAVEYGLQDRILHDPRPVNDREMAMRYSACDVTVVISGGEGFCYPVAESLSCGTPVVTGAYGAQAELVPWTVKPVATVIETSHNVRRAVYTAYGVRTVLEAAIGARFDVETCVHLVEHLDMPKLGVQWKRWFRRGL